MPDNRKDYMYLRLSQEDGDVEEGAMEESCSIASQRRCIEAFISGELGLDPASFDEIVDDGYSGTRMSRPGITKLLRLVEAGMVKTIIVRDLSRFARNYLDAGHYLEFVFPAYQVRFISINDHFDSKALGEETGGLELAIRNLINDMYSRDISRKIKSAVDLKKMNGEFVYGTAPYGYKKAPKKNAIEIDGPAAAVVKRIFQWAQEGVTITQIANRLNEAHEPTPSVYLASVRGKYKTRGFWTYDSVRNILNNRIYTGDTEPFKSHVERIGTDRVKHIPEEERIVLPNTHEAIITREEYERAKGIVKSNRKSAPREKRNPLTSYLVCGCCGNRLAKGKSQNKTWHCSSARYSGDLACKEIHVDDEQMQDILLSAIQNQAKLLNARIENLIVSERARKTETEILCGEIRKRRKQLSAIQERKIEEYEKYASGEMEKEDFLKVRRMIMGEEEAAKVELKLLEERLQSADADQRQMEAQKNSAGALTPYAQVTELTPEIMRELVKRVVVYPDHTVSIEWNFRDEMVRILKIEKLIVLGA